ncbi:MAG: TIR domain-containing protein [Bacteroidota bacterium]|nr:TIR domain-containing protein [Bacteroidota bacterium]
MADIFISYSSKDREKAEQLTELLASAGLSVWIDHSGIDVATSWSGEIVDAIDGCRALVVLLSPSSNESKNVAKEVALAAERNKKILPLDLEPITLSRDLAYHLAGIQRAPMTNIDSIIRTLSKLGLETTKAPTIALVKEPDSRKSLMILPFEDLSPTQDNGWFTDGIASEMVSTLSNIKSLRLIDWNTSRMLKNKSIKTVELAKEFAVRYFIEGQVRKFGDQIKISMTLLDIETGDHLWQDSLKGTMEDIFDIQEQCAAKVVSGLELHLTKEEQVKVSKKPTENAEAYELYLKAIEYGNRYTRSDLEQALLLYEEAVRRDPGFSAAYTSIANTYQELYRQYARSKSDLVRAESAAAKVRELEGETAQYLWVMSIITLRRGDKEGAVRFALRVVETDPAYALGYAALGAVYHSLGRLEEVVQARENYVRLRENDKHAHYNLLISLGELGDSPDARERLRLAAERAIPVYERHVRLNPDDYNARVELASIFPMVGRESEALTEADTLSAVQSMDGYALYNLACLYLHCHRPERVMSMLRRSVEKGFRNLETFRRDPDLDPLRSTPEFEELIRELEGVSNHPGGNDSSLHSKH